MLPSCKPRKHNKDSLRRVIYPNKRFIETSKLWDKVYSLRGQFNIVNSTEFIILMKCLFGEAKQQETCVNDARFESKKSLAEAMGVSERVVKNAESSLRTKGLMISTGKEASFDNRQIAVSRKVIAYIFDEPEPVDIGGRWFTFTKEVEKTILLRQTPRGPDLGTRSGPDLGTHSINSSNNFSSTRGEAPENRAKNPPVSHTGTKKATTTNHHLAGSNNAGVKTTPTTNLPLVGFYKQINKVTGHAEPKEKNALFQAELNRLGKEDFTYVIAVMEKEEIKIVWTEPDKETEIPCERFSEFSDFLLAERSGSG